MKRILTIVISILTLSLYAQEYANNIVETDCGNNTESVSEAIETINIPLLVIASGYDCGICRNEAPGFNEMADTLVGEGRVWGAMHYRFSSNSPSCNDLDSWKNSYGWDNIFMFNDVNNGTAKSWAQGGYTSFTVIARDKEYLYRGTNRTTALATFFQEIKNKPTSISDEGNSEASFVVEDGQLKFKNFNQASGSVQVVNSLGQRIASIQINNEVEKVIDVTSNSKLFIATFITKEGKRITEKLIW